jgi:hypothetical protein
MYQPITGQRCVCRPGIERDNCPACEGTGWRIDFAAIRAHRAATVEIWDCRSCGWRGVLPERSDEDDFSCPECGSTNTAFQTVEAAHAPR